MGESEFLCPECGSREAEQMIFRDPMPNKIDPWSMVLQVVECAACHSVIPAHLAELWNGKSAEEAGDEWRRVYRKAGRKMRC
jgi:uncharacterized Zn finger protein